MHVMDAQKVLRESLYSFTALSWQDGCWVRSVFPALACRLCSFSSVVFPKRNLLVLCYSCRGRGGGWFVILRFFQESLCSCPHPSSPLASAAVIVGPLLVATCISWEERYLPLVWSLQIWLWQCWEQMEGGEGWRTWCFLAFSDCLALKGMWK